MELPDESTEEQPSLYALIRHYFGNQPVEETDEDFEIPRRIEYQRPVDFS